MYIQYVYTHFFDFHQLGSGISWWMYFISSDETTTRFLNSHHSILYLRSLVILEEKNLPSAKEVTIFRAGRPAVASVWLIYDVRIHTVISAIHS